MEHVAATPRPLVVSCLWVCCGLHCDDAPSPYESCLNAKSQRSWESVLGVEIVGNSVRHRTVCICAPASHCLSTVTVTSIFTTLESMLLILANVHIH